MSVNKISVGTSDNIPLAVGTIVLTVLALSLGDALIKMTSAKFVIWQIFVLRSIIAIPWLILFIVVSTKKRPSLTPVFGWTLIRSLLLMSMWVIYYVSLPHLTLSVAAAAYYTLPLFIALFSAAILGDPVGRTGWIAVFVGFCGVVLILRPKAGDFNWYAVLPLFSAILYAAAMILTRTKCRSVHPLMLSLILNCCFVFVGLVVACAIASLPVESRVGFLLAPWAAMALPEWLSMGLLAMAILAGSIGTAIAYQNGPPSIVGTFDFAYVGFAVLWGVVFFAEIPDGISVSGMILIVVAGLMSLRQ